MLRWLWGGTDVAASEPDRPDSIMANQPNAEDEEDGVDFSDENTTRSVLKQLRDIQHRHDEYTSTVNDLCKKVDNLVKYFQSGARSEDTERTQSVADQLQTEMAKLRMMVDKMGSKYNDKRDAFWQDHEYDENASEANFISAIRRNDLATVQRILNEEHEFNLDIVGADGKFAIQIALENEYVEMSTLLFSRGVKIGVAFLRLIESDCPSAVALICNHQRIFKTNNQDIFAAHDTDDEFPVETTPIILAARMNRFQILKILLKFGAQMPTLEETRSRFDSHRPGRATAVFHVCEALSSESYLLQTSDDLLRDVFETTEMIRRVRDEEKNSLEERGVSDEYTLLEERLEDMEVRIFDLVNGEEVATMLTGDDPDAGKQFDCCMSIPANLPARLCQAMDLKHKKFVAHSKCQEYIWGRWRLGFDEHMNRSAFRRCLATLILGTCWPILGVIYLICAGFKSCSTLTRLFQTPYVKFVLNTSSRIILLTILTFQMLDATIFYITSHATSEELEDAYMEYRTHSTLHPAIVWLWILGMTWREVMDMCRQGIRMYARVGWSQIEIPQLILYWIYIICNIWAFFEARNVVNNGEIEKLAQKKNLTELLPCDMTQLAESDGNTDTDCVRYISLMPRLGELESRLDWHPYEPLLIAEAAFAIANVLTFVRLLDCTVLIAHLGILQVSLMRMFSPVFQFLCLWSFIWVSFSLGLTQLYRPYEDVKRKHCHDTEMEDCQETHFTDLWESMRGLFWTLFGFTKYDSLDLPPNLHMTQNVGQFIFALYLLLTLTFLMNMLIAMLGGAFTAIQSNADTEWKFARSVIMCEYVIDSAIVPPPLNLVPSTANISAWFRTFAGCKRSCQEGSTAEPSEVEMEDTECKKAASSLDYQITSAAVKRRYIRNIMKGSGCLFKHPAVDVADNAGASGKGSGEAEENAQGGRQGMNNSEAKHLLEVCEVLKSDMGNIKEKLSRFMERYPSSKE